MLFEILSTLAAGLFAGATTYISIVEHPARINCGVDLAIQSFKSSYRRGAPFMGSILLTGLVCAIAAWRSTSNDWWLIGAALLLFPIPYTIIFILPLSKKLLDLSPNENNNLASKLLKRWAALHLLRSLMGLAAFTAFLALLARGASR
jgi:hypothetical protein